MYYQVIKSTWVNYSQDVCFPKQENSMMRNKWHIKYYAPQILVCSSIRNNKTAPMLSVWSSSENSLFSPDQINNECSCFLTNNYIKLSGEGTVISYDTNQHDVRILQLH